MSKPKAAKGEQALRVPKFKSEAEEAEWWFQRRDVLAVLLEKHGRRVPPRKVERSKVVTIRLYETDLARARQLAEKKGIRYQTYIRMLLHEALEREVS